MPTIRRFMPRRNPTIEGEYGLKGPITECIVFGNMVLPADGIPPTL